MNPAGNGPARPPVTDWLVLALRAYSEPASPPPPKPQSDRPKPSDWVLVFDCETKTTPDQGLRFGAYQLRHRGHLRERGVFYDADGLDPAEIETLAAFMVAERPSDAGERIFMRTCAAFVEEVFMKQTFAVGAQIVGLNLPFDISRIARRHVNARGSMKGGFSFVLSEDPRWPKVAVKHLSARTSLFRFTGSSTPRQFDPVTGKPEPRPSPDRGYFVDLKTLAATLTSGSHSLASLTRLLNVPTEKRATDDHDKPLEPDYIRYAIRDVQATWECFEALAARVAGFDLPNAGLYELFSEASLGKAYLAAMGVRPWREVQPAFPREHLGRIMSAYFGGRAEVHVRRQIVEVIHCDFLSMYPTVCTLMGLWRFVIADGVTWSDATDQVRDQLGYITAADLQSKTTWSDLAVLVQVAPDADILPVRACYGDGPTPNIGLNYLSSDEPLWFTLADLIAAKISTGKPPRVLQAVRYTPKEIQPDLRPVTVAGKPLDPTTGDFYRDLIDHRTEVKRRMNAPDAYNAALDAEQLAIKILANSTSYGIFMELNVEDRTKSGPMHAHGARPAALHYNSPTVEKPGRYFHPLLGALITGAARLMLALAERQVIDQGLDWAFCDTDSLAIANIAAMPREDFHRRAFAVRDWFSDLNPYAAPGPILKVEDVNYVDGSDGAPKVLEPLYCLAISAKRYVQFNRGPDGEPIVRKASGHGLGHLMDPYADKPEETAAHIKAVGAPRWQQDVWKAAIAACDAGKPDVVALGNLAGFNEPARSQYAATTPELLSWFSDYNTGKPYKYQLRPFNFLLSLQLRSDIDLVAGDMDPLAAGGRAKPPRPAAPFTRSASKAALQAFDRKTGAPIAPATLKSLGRSLVRYHLHPETKFLPGTDDAIGILPRRHVKAVAIQAIGKEADALDERLFIGEGDAAIIHPMDGADVGGLFKFIWTMQTELGLSDRDLASGAGLSHHTLAKLRKSGGAADVGLRLVQAIETFRKSQAAIRAESDRGLRAAQYLAAELGGPAALARRLGLSRQYVGRILRGERPVPDDFAARIGRLMSEIRAERPVE